MSEAGNDGQDAKPDKGFWTVEERADANGNRDIFFGVIRQGCPTAQQQLKDEIERTLSVLRVLYGKDTKFNEAFDKLLALAQVGLPGVDPAVSTAKAALASLQAEVVGREAGRIKNTYMVKLGSWALLGGALGFLAFFILDQNFPWVSLRIFKYRYFFLLWSGCMAGAWVSFATRKAILSFFDLVAVEDDQVEPPLRLLFTGILTVILALVFTTGLANVVIGGFQASSLLVSGSTAILVGAFAGLSEKALPAALMKRAQDFIAASAASSGK
ncbi:hypothetical protein [Caulobacter segnis]